MIQEQEKAEKEVEKPEVPDASGGLSTDFSTCQWPIGPDDPLPYPGNPGGPIDPVTGLPLFQQMS